MYNHLCQYITTCIVYKIQHSKTVQTVHLIELILESTRKVYYVQTLIFLLQKHLEMKRNVLLQMKNETQEYNIIYWSPLPRFYDFINTVCLFLSSTEASTIHMLPHSVIRKSACQYKHMGLVLSYNQGHDRRYTVEHGFLIWIP